MIKLTNREAVIERYWPDYLDICMRSRDDADILRWLSPTVDGFWLWYIKDGPMGLKHRGQFYNKKDVEYL